MPEAQAWRAAHQPPVISATATPPPAAADQTMQPSALQAWRAQFTSAPAITGPSIDRFAENHQGAAAHGYGVTVDRTPLIASANPDHAGEAVPFHYAAPITGADARLASGAELAALDPAGAHAHSGAKGFQAGRALMTPYGLIQVGGTGAKTYIGDETGNRTAQFMPHPAPATPTPTPNIAHNDIRGISQPIASSAPQIDALSSGINPVTPFATPQITAQATAPLPTVQINPALPAATRAAQPTVQINPTAQLPRAAKPAPRPGSDLDWNMAGFKSFGNWLTGNSIHNRLHGQRDKLVSAY